jgi:predicted ABC-type sugar transport system permease subunit
MAEARVPAKPVDNRGVQSSLLLRYGSQLGIIGVGLAMWLGFVIAAPRVFTDLDIYRAFAETTPQFGIAALSLTFVVITGEIDLSFPSVMALGAAAFCLVTAYGGAPWWFGLDFRARDRRGLRCRQRPPGRRAQHPLSCHHHRHPVPLPRP